MAYVDDEQENSEFETMGAPAAQGAAASSSSATPGAPQKAPSNFVQFDRYFQANSGAANQMAGGIADNAAGKGAAADTAVKGVTDDFNARVAQAGMAAPTVTAAGGGRQNVANAEYAGPSAFGEGQDLTGVYSAVGDAQKALGYTKDPESLQTYFQDNNTNASYTDGMSRFDAALAGMAGGDRFNDIRSQYANLDNWFQNAANQGSQAVDAAKSGIEARNTAANKTATVVNNAVNEQRAESEEERRRRTNTQRDERLGLRRNPRGDL